jgi:hypothetical protein
MPAPRRFPPPWSVDDLDPKLSRQCFIARDANGQALAYVYFEDELGRRTAAKLLTRDEARRIAATFLYSRVMNEAFFTELSAWLT